MSEWIAYDSQIHEPYLNCGNILKEGAVRKVEIKDRNVTTNYEYEYKCILESGSEIQALKQELTPGIHEITLVFRTGDTKHIETICFYQPYSVSTKQYQLTIEMKHNTEENRTKICISSDVNLPEGMLYFDLPDIPIHFLFPEILGKKKKKEQYFLIQTPPKTLLFRLRPYAPPDDAEVFGDASLDYGIRINVKQED